MAFYKASDLLLKCIRRSGDPQTIFAVWVCKTWKDISLEIYPKNTPKAKYFRAGKLTVETKSSSEANDLRLREKELIDKINSKLGKKVVIRLQFKTNY